MHFTRAATAVLTCSTLLVAGCSTKDPLDTSQDRDGSSEQTISLGTANFPESEIIGQIWASALRDAGYDVDVKSGIGSREVYLQALEEGTIDIVPEYAGNLTQFYGELPQGADEDDVRAALTDALPDNFEAGAFSPAESKDSYRVTRAAAEEYGLVTISDLDKLDDITIAAPPEFAERPYGPQGLTDIYGIDADKITVSPISDGGGPLTVAALVEGAANTANIFTTSPALLSDGSEADLVTLDDPERLIPPQNVVPVVRAGALPEGALDVINSTNEMLTTQDLVEMNLRNVGEEHAEPAAIAKDWMKNK